MVLKKLKAFFRLIKNKIAPYWGLIFRIALCFITGLGIYFASLQSHFDSRFMLRGAQKFNSDIIIITIGNEDLAAVSDVLDSNTKNILRSLKEIGDARDAFYWNLAIWEKAFNRLLNSHPKAIVVTLLLGKDIPPSFTKNPNIFWASKSDEDLGPNMGSLRISADPDGLIRSYSNSESSLVHMISKKILNFEPSTDPKNLFINYLGPQNSFKTFSFSDLMRGKLKDSTLKNKIIILTTNDYTQGLVSTPVGLLSTGEWLANVLQNYISNLWVRELPWPLGLLLLILILTATLWVIFNYPESVALVFLSFLSIGVIVLSIALFDKFSLWFPLQAPLVLIIFTYIITTGYRLGESEKHSWKSQQELIYLSEVESLKNNFLSLISHDLKNPLAKIQGITDRLLNNKEAPVDEATKEDLHTIRKTSDELRQYITSILHLTRVEARDVKLNKEVCDINIIVNEALQRLAPLAKEKNIQILFTEEPLFSMELDKALITEVLINLVENAIKYSERGKTITVQTHEEGENVLVEVTDQAGGIAEEELPKIFDKFFRGKGDKTIKVTGSGLGLYLVKYFIELHGGKVFINSKLGEGTKIGFTLPIS